MSAMILTLAAFAVSATPAPIPASVGLANLPNTTIRYYDVDGRNVTEINRSIAMQRAKTANGKPIPASTDWSVSADFERTVTDGQCRVTAAKVNMKAEVELPRVVNEDALQPAVRTRWSNYVGLLEDGALNTLAFVHHNLKTIEQVIRSSSCDKAKPAAAAMIERLRLHTARMAAERELQLGQQNRSLAEFRPGMLTDREKICKDLDATGSRLRTFRVCMPRREWDRLAEGAEKFTADVQNHHSTSGKYFGTR